MSTPAIETSRLTRYYGRQRGIEDLDLTVRAGEVFGFLGPNGAGKTTTIRLLLDLIRPTRGEARVLGLDCHRQSLAVRRLVGYLPGEYRFYEDLTGRRLLDYLGRLGGTFDPAIMHILTGRLGADLDRPVRRLSHGNKQKLGIVQAFMHDAPLLILDEPTTGLDPLVQQEFFSLIEESRRAGRTVLLSSHNLAEVERVCDRFASVRDGRLIAVEEMASLRGRAVRVVKLTCARPLAREAFAALPGLEDLVIEGVTLQASVHGTLEQLLAAAAPFELVDILSREPNLEEFFLALYGRAEACHAG
ncbi:MAG: ABC transporter ATP-binding protein [Candidatus Krumholzibacteriia bacterium]